MLPRGESEKKGVFDRDDVSREKKKKLNDGKSRMIKEKGRSRPGTQSIDEEKAF